MSPIETAVLVALPEADDIVGPFRARFDRSAGWGVPPHVTVLYPFLAPDLIDESVLVRLTRAVGAIPAFDVVFERVSWFGDEVLWLAPKPDDPLRALTAAVCHEFPGLLPYGGTVADPTPHLTIGHDAPIDVLRGVADAIGPLLPIEAYITSVLLMQGSPDAGAWHPVRTLGLA